MNFVNSHENFADDGVLQFTLREMQLVASNFKIWIGLFVVILILTVSGPFATLDNLAIFPRFAYWASISVLTFAANMFTLVAVGRILSARSWNRWPRNAVAAVFASIPVTIIVWFVSAFLAGISEPTMHALFWLFPQCAPISILITMLIQLSSSSPDLARSAAADHMAVKLIDRLSPELGRSVYSLQSQDHYVEVTTASGKELILLRLEDAIKEMYGVDGIQVHRSWWVSESAVASLGRTNGKLTLQLKNGSSVPVSRRYQADVRQLFSNL